ncbi:MAG: ABC transporter ATP-binding protein [Clostridia bacterium]|nr:ABC transporter ATP-binding protein [Clostridia bacterium]
MSKLTCRDVNVGYFGYDNVIRGFSADFSDGFNVVFAGEKGGKTTLLKGLAGVIESKGDILFDGEDVRGLSLQERDFAMVFDDLALFERRSVRYNLEYPLKLRKLPKERRNEIVREAAALFDLDVMIDAAVYKLNVWHKTALSLCRAYLRRARVTFIDNVFASLDLETRREAFYRFMPLFSGRGIVVYATDSVSEAAFLSEEILYLNCGYLLQKGSLSELSEKPACAASFLTFSEHAALLPARLTEEGIKVFDFLFSFDKTRLIGENYIGKEVLLGLRPEDAEIALSGASAVFQGRFFGEKGSLCALNVEGNPLFILGDTSLSVGEEVKFIVRKVFALFDVVNERAIVRY